MVRKWFYPLQSIVSEKLKTLGFEDWQNAAQVVNRDRVIETYMCYRQVGTPPVFMEAHMIKRMGGGHTILIYELVLKATD